MNLDDKYRGLIRKDAALDAFAGSNADEAAADLSAANELGLSPEAAITAPGLSDEARSLDNKYRLQIAKKTGRFLQTPENAAIAHDDVEALTDLENTFERMRRPTPDMDLLGVAGYRTAAERLRYEQDLSRTVAAEEQIQAAQRDRTAGDVAGNIGRSMAVGLGPRFARQAYGVAAAPFDVLSAVVGAPATGIGLLPQDPFAVAAEGFRGLSREASAAEAAMRGDQRGIGPIEGAVASGFESLTNMLPGTVLALLTGSPTAMIAAGATQVGGEEYTRAREAGLGVPGALGFAAGQGGIEALTERIPAAKLFADLKVGSGLFKTILNNQLREQPTEQVATALQDLNEWVTLNPDRTIQDYLAERPEAAAQTAIATLVASGAMTTAAYSAERGFNLLSTPEQKAASQAEALYQLAEKAEASKLKQRAPDKLVSFVNSVSPESEIRIPAQEWQALHQAKEVDPARSYAAAGGTVDGYVEALAAGGDLVFPVGEYVVRVPLDMQKALIPKLRTSPGAMTQEESEAFEKDREKFVGEAGKLLSDQEPDGADGIYEDVLGQLLDTGMNRKDAEAQALLYRNRYRTRAQRLGVDPMELYSQSNLSVETQIPSEESLKQQTETPAFANWFGDSKVVDAEGKPLVVYHGTPADFESFKMTEGRFGRGAYFWDSPEKASAWAQSRAENGPKGDRRKASGSPNVVPVFLRNAERIPGGWVIRDPRDAKSAVGNRGTFDPNDPSILRQGEETPRGVFVPRRLNAANRAIIALTKEKNRSTFLHESGHLWLEELAEDAGSLDGKADLTPDQQGILDDMQAVLDLFGIKDRSTWNAMTLEQQREHHEKFARGFESYLRDGKAPSEELRGVFARFKQWLINIYRQISSLNVEIDDSIRGVFDRLLATQTELDALQADVRPIFESKPDSMTDAEWASYQRSLNAAKLEADEEVNRRAMEEETRASKQWWKDRSAEVREQVEEEYSKQPKYNAYSFLTTGRLLSGEIPEVGPVKLSKDGIAAIKGKDWAKQNVRGLYSAEGGIDPDELAPLFGYQSGAQLLDALTDVRKTPLAKAVDAETERRMLEENGDLRNMDQALMAAVNAMHNDRMADLLVSEIKILAPKSQTSRQIIRASAKALIANKRVRDLRPNEYLVNERKAGRQAYEAAAKGKLAEAADFKRQQLLNHEMYRAALEAKDKVDSAIDYFGKFEKARVRQRIGTDGDYLQKIDAARNQYGLAMRNAAEPDSKAKLNADIQAGVFEAPQSVITRLSGTKPVDFRGVSTGELLGLRALIRQIEATANSERNIEVFNQKLALNDVAAELAGAMQANVNQKPLALGGETASEKFRQGVSNFFTNITRTSMLARKFDGSDNGPWTQYVVNLIRQAGTKAEGMREQVRQDLTAIYSKHFTPDQLEENNQRAYVSPIGKPLSKWDLISLALNMGNESNRAAVYDGMVNGQKVYTPANVDALLKNLTANDLGFVQDIWDYIDTYWPELKAAQERRKGIAPQKVEATPFVVNTESGPVTLRGGYYPLKYDRRLDARARQNDMEDAFAKMTAGVMSSAQNKYAHNQERVGSGGQPVALDINVISRHLGNVVQDISMGDAVMAVDKMLNHPEVRSAFVNSGNMDTLEYLKLWLKDSATGEIAPADSASRMVQALRANFTLSKMAFNFSNQLLNIAGLPQTMAVIGPKAFLRGVQKFSQGPKQAFNAMTDASEFMRLRFSTDQFNKDIALLNQMLSAGPNDPTGGGVIGALVKASRAVRMNPVYIKYAYLGARATQMLVDTVTWHGAYNKGIGQGMSHDEAVRYADGQVDIAQTSGMFSSRSGIERGTLSETTRQSEWVKIWTTLGSYMIAKGNIAAEKYRETDFKDPVKVLNFAVQMGLLFAVDAIALAALRGEWPDDDEPWAWWGAKKFGEQAAGTIPLVREIPGAMKGFGSGGGPIGALIGDVGRAATQTSQGDIDAALMKSYINLIGDFTGIPAAQINRAIGAWWEDQEGEEVAPYEYILGVRKE